LTPRDLALTNRRLGRNLGRCLRFLRRCCWVAALALAWSLPAQAAPPRIVIIDLLPRSLPAPHDKTDLAVELSHTIEAAGCPVARICRSPDCRAPQKDEDDVHFLTFEGRYEQTRFSCAVMIEVRRTPNGPIEYQDQGTNPVCPAARLIMDTREAGRRACDELRVARAAPVNPTWNLQPAVPTAVPPPVVVVAKPTAARTAAPMAKARPWLGPVLIAVGSGIAAYGAYQVAQHGDLSHCATSNLGEQVCTHTKQRPLAIPLLLLGAGGIGWGVWEISARRDLDLLEGLTMVSARTKF
jgi:hypothetical protein